MSLIELFDAKRLQPPRRWDALNPMWLPVLACAGVLAWGGYSQSHHGQLRSERLAADAELTRLKALTNTDQADVTAANRLALSQRADKLEGELAALDAGPGEQPAPLPPSGWMTRLEQLAAPRISLTRVEIDRGGAARLEGMALDAAAISSFVSAWGAHEEMAALPPRMLDVQHSPRLAPGTTTAEAGANQPGLLKFVVRAEAWPRSRPAAGASPAAAASTPGPAGAAAAKAKVQP